MKRRNGMNGNGHKGGNGDGRRGIMVVPDMPGEQLTRGKSASLKVLWMLMASGAFSLREAVSVDRLAFTLGYPEVGMVMDLLRGLRCPQFAAIWRYITEPGAGYTVVCWISADAEEIGAFARELTMEAEPYRVMALQMREREESRMREADHVYFEGRDTGCRLARDGAREAMQRQFRGFVSERSRRAEEEAAASR